MPQQDFYTQ